MAERPSKRSRVSSEDSEGTDDWLPQAMSMNNRPGQAPSASARTTDAASRARRGPSQDPQRPIRLTVKKTAPSRLQEYTGVSSDDDDDSKRKRRSLNRESKNKKPIVDQSSDEEAEDDEDDDAGLDDLDDEEEDEEEDAEAEEDDDEDEEMDDDDGDDTPMSDAPAPARPTIKLSAPRGEPKTTATARLKQAGVTPVEEKELASSAASDDEDDDEEPEEDPPDLQNMPEDEDEEDDDDEGEDMGDGDDIDDTIRADGLADSDLDSSDGEARPAGKGGNARRRRAISPSNLMALSNEAQKKKFFTADEISMRRAEMARRRKDLSEKRNEEEKANTLKRLLEKPVPTRRSRAQVLADLEREEFGPGRGSDDGGEHDGPRAKAAFVRSVAGRYGTAVGVPREWLAAPVGRVFDGAQRPNAAKGEAWDKDTLAHGRLVQVIE